MHSSHSYPCVKQRNNKIPSRPKVVLKGRVYSWLNWERTRSWGLQPKPAAAELRGKGVSTVLGWMVLFFDNEFGEERCKSLWKNLHWLWIRDGGVGWGRWRGASSGVDSLEGRSTCCFRISRGHQFRKFMRKQDAVTSDSWLFFPDNSWRSCLEVESEFQ